MSISRRNDKNALNRATGRGSEVLNQSRFEKHSRETDLSQIEWLDEDDVSLVQTQVFKDTTKKIISHNSSPDIGFRSSINAYRGCEHGCAYCYARPTHEYLGHSAGLDFESKIYVKEHAPELLRAELLKKSWEPEVIMMSGVTDCYQPLERKYQLTRRLLKVLAEFKNPVGLITKNHLITRDLDILREMAEQNLVLAFVSITTLNVELGRKLEPRTSTPDMRLKAIKTLSEAGVPVGVNVAPVIPGLTDHEMPGILERAREEGATMAGFVPLRLPYSVTEIFSEWLSTHRPESRDKVLSGVRDIRAGDLNDPDFKSRMRGEGPKAEHLRAMFKLFTKKFGLNQNEVSLRTDLFCRPGDQLELF